MRHVECATLLILIIDIKIVIIVKVKGLRRSIVLVRMTEDISLSFLSLHLLLSALVSLVAMPSSFDCRVAWTLRFAAV